MQNEQFDIQSLLPLGTLLQMGKYRVDRYLSSGGFGNTYVITNLQFEEQFAMKEFFMKGINERNEDNTTISVSNKTNRPQFEQQREKFKKEARRLRKLRNKHIVQVHDLFEENGTSYYVMDYVDGESLSNRMKRTGKQLSEKEVLAILPQVLEALEAVHEKGIWHLDLKPGNIMVEGNGNAVLIDFGASKQMSASEGYTTTTTAMCYTQGYAPPEQMDQNMALIGAWTDLYALGATLYNLLTKNKPPMVSEMLGKNAYSYPIPVSDKTKYLIRWMMTPNREGRPQSVKEVQDFLHKPFDKNETSSKKTDDTDEETRLPDVAEIKKKDDKKWKKWIPLAVIGVVLFVGVFFFATKSKSSSASDDVDTINVTQIETEEAQEPKKVEKMYFDSPLGIGQYTGTIDDDQMPHGTGEVTFSDGRLYRGPFIHGKFEGKDAYFKYDNGDTFEGIFMNNGFSKGRYTIKDDGSYFIGTFKNGQPDKGQWHDKKGDVISQLFYREEKKKKEEIDPQKASNKPNKQQLDIKTLQEKRKEKEKIEKALEQATPDSSPASGLG